MDIIGYKVTDFEWRKSVFPPDWDGLLLAQLEWLGMAEVGFSLSGMV
jgi:hypothetical protein